MTSTVSISSGLWIGLGFLICFVLVAALVWAEKRKPFTEQEREIEDCWGGFERARERHAGPESRTDRLPYSGRDRAA